MSLKICMVSAALAFAALTGVASRAQASIALPPEHIYTFTGACAVGDCAGFATGVLTFRGNLENGVYALEDDVFESFTYQSNVEGFSLSGAERFEGQLGTTPGSYDVFIAGNASNGTFHTLLTNVSGSWCATCTSDTGPKHVWMQGLVSPAPEPSTWTLLLVGVGLVGAALRRTAGSQATDGMILPLLSLSTLRRHLRIV